MITTDMFNWNPKTKTFTQEISTLSQEINTFEALGGCFYYGIMLENPKTNGQAHFVFKHKIYETTQYEQEIVGWKFWNREHKIFLIIWND